MGKVNNHSVQSLDLYSKDEWIDFLKQGAYRGLKINKIASNLEKSDSCIYTKETHKLELIYKHGTTITLDMAKLLKKNDRWTISRLIHNIKMCFSDSTYATKFNARITKLAEEIIKTSTSILSKSDDVSSGEEIIEDLYSDEIINDPIDDGIPDEDLFDNQEISLSKRYMELNAKCEKIIEESNLSQKHVAELEKIKQEIKTRLFSLELEQFVDNQNGDDRSCLETKSFFDKNFRIINASIGDEEIQSNLLKLSHITFENSNDAENRVLAYQMQCTGLAMNPDDNFMWVLPKEITGLFFKTCKYNWKDFTNFSLVNKSWHNIIEKERLQKLNEKSIRFNDIPGLRSIKNQINYIKSHGKNLQSIVITSGYSKDAFYGLIDYMPNVSDLCMQGCTWFSDEDIPVLVGLKKLSDLNLSLCNITDKGLPHFAELGNLSNLDLSWTDVTNQGLENLDALNLSSLDLEGCSSVQSQTENKHIKTSSLNEIVKNKNKGHLYLKDLDGTTKTISVNVSEMTTGSLIKICQKKIGCPSPKLRAVFAGKSLEKGDNRILSDYNLQLESTVHLVLGLCGD